VQIEIPTYLRYGLFRHLVPFLNIYRNTPVVNDNDGTVGECERCRLVCLLPTHSYYADVGSRTWV